MEVVAIDKTVQGVYDKAIRLIDAQNENTGSTIPATRGYASLNSGKSSRWSVGWLC